MSTTDKQIIEKLDLILRVLSVQIASDKSLTERARLLKIVGLDNKTISDVLNISIASVRTLTSKI